MNDLNAQQIVLLTLLVSFVTSIATGITTVSLLEQAPEPVTQTINRVVEKTVERVVEVESDQEKTVERIVETVVVSEDDLTVEAVSNNSASLVRIYSKVGDLNNFAGIGLITSSDFEIITDSVNISNGNEYVGVFPNGEEIELEIISNENTSAYSKLKISNESETAPLNTKVAGFGDSEKMQLGQSVIALSGIESNMVSTGIVTSLNTETITEDVEGQDEVKVIEKLNSIDTSVNATKIVTGSILLTLQGEIVGFSSGSGSTIFETTSAVKDFINSTNEISEEGSDITE
jgi:hypothetical protein